MTVPGGRRSRVWLQACLVALLFDLLVFPPGAEAEQIALSWQGGTGNFTSSHWCLTPCPAFPNNSDGSGNTYLATIGAGNDEVTLNNTSSFTGIALDGLTIGRSDGTGSSTLNIANNSLTIASPSSPGTLLTINGSGSLNIQNGGMLTFQNTASTIISGPNTSTILNNGNISLSSTSAVSPATLSLNDAGQGNVFDLTGGGTLSMSGQAQITGATGNAASLINDVGHTISGAGTIAGLAGSSSTVGFTNNGIISVTNGGTGNNNLTIDTSNAATPLSGFYNAGSINVADGATLTLRNTSGASGFGVFLNDGGITLGSNGSGAALVLDSGNTGTPFFLSTFAGTGTLNLTGSSTISGATGTESLTNDVSHTINIDADGSTGTSTIGKLASFTNNGTINIGTGTAPSSAISLVIDTTGSSGGLSNPGFSNSGFGTVLAGDGTKLVFQNTNAGTAVFNNDGVITIGSSAGASLVLNGAGTVFDLTSSGATGTVVLNGASGISGQTGGESLINDMGHTISNNGTGSISNLTAFTNNGTLSVTSGKLTVAGSANLTNWNGAGALTGGTYSVAGGGILQLSALGSSNITAIGANTALILSSTGEIVNGSNANALSALANNAGTLTLTSEASLHTSTSEFTNSGSVTIGAGSTLTVDSGIGTFDLQEGSLSGSGTLDANLYQTGGTLNPGDPQSITIDGSYVLSSGTLQLDILNYAAVDNGNYDRVNVEGEVALAGILDLDLLDPDFDPALGDVFDVINASTIALEAGFQFDDLVFDNGAETFALNVNGAGDELELTVVSTAPEPGTLSMLFGALLIAGATRRRWNRRGAGFSAR